MRPMKGEEDTRLRAVGRTEEGRQARRGWVVGLGFGLLLEGPGAARLENQTISFLKKKNRKRLSRVRNIPSAASIDWISGVCVDMVFCQVDVDC